MKKRMRVLSLLLCLALLMSAAPAEPLALAEEIAEATPAPVEAPVEPEIPDEAEATVEPEAPATESPAIETVEPEPEAVPDEAEAQPVEGDPLPAETPEPEAVDFTADASHSPAFALGYAEVLEDDTPVYEDEGEQAKVIVRLGRGVVYALERSERPEEGEAERPDRLRVAFNLGGDAGIAEGWLDARSVRPMEPEEEVPAFREFCAGLDDVRLYRDDPEIPLARIAHMMPEAETEQPAATVEATPTAAPESQGGHPLILSESTPEADAGALPEETAHPIFMPELQPTAEPENTAIPEGESSDYNGGAPEISVMPLPLEEPLLEVADVQPEIAQDEIELYPGATADLELTLPEGATAQLSSSDDGVVTVTEAGELAAVAPGEATVTLTALDATDVCRVQVLALPQLNVKSDALRLGVGENFDLLGEGFVTSSVEAASLRFSALGDCVGMGADGVLRALSKGKAIVTVEVAGSAVKASFTAQVDAAPTGVSLRDSLTLSEGMSGNVGLSFAPSGSYFGYDFSSSREDVATVGADGSVKAISAGRTTITVRTRNNLCDTCAVTVCKAPARIELESDTVTLAEGETGRAIVATAYDDEDAAIPCEFTYEVDGPSIVDVKNGELQPLCAGDTSVTVRAKDYADVFAVCTVHVVRDAKRVTLRREAITLGVGDTFKLSDGPDGIIEVPAQERVLSYSYKSTNTTCATVGAKGLITAKKKGTTKIQITPQGGETVVLSVTVKPASTSIAFNASALTVGACATATLKVKFSSDAACDYSIASSDPSGDLLSFEREGTSDTWLIRAKEVFEPKTVTLTVRSSLNGYSDTCAVTILPGPRSADEIVISANKDILGRGEEGGKVSASVAPGVRAAGGFSYNSSNASVLSVDSDGTLHAHAASLTPVTVTATANVPFAKDQFASASLQISVVAYPTAFRLNEGRETLKLGVGDSYDLAADPDDILYIYPEDARTSYTYAASSKEGKIASTSAIAVSADGRITAKAAGTAFVHITPHSGSDTGTEVLRVEVSKAAESVALNAGALRLGMGMTGTLKVKLPSKTYLRFSVENSDGEVLRLTRNGQTLTLKPLRPGTATVTVRSENGKFADSCAVTVLEAPTEADIALSLSAPDRLGVTESGKISVALPGDKLGAITFESEDPDALEVNATTGALTAKALPARGTSVYVWVLVDGARAYFHEIEILPAPKSLTLAADAITIEAGRTYQLNDALVQPDAGAGAVYSYKVFSDKKCTKASTTVASVGAKGVITAKKKGTAYVRISTQSSASAVLTVNVVAKNKGFALEPQTLTLGVGMSGTLTALRAPEDMRYAFDDAIVTIDEDGTVTAIGPGTCVVRAGSGDALYGATASVTVLPAPTAEQISLSEDATLRVSAFQKDANVRAAIPEGTMAELAYRIVGETPEGISLNEETGALTAGPDVPDAGSFTVEVYDVNNPEVSRAFEIQLVPTAAISGLKATKLQLGVGEKFRLRDGRDGIIQLAGGNEDATASYTFATYSDKNCKTKSSAVASVDAVTGLLTGKKVGTAYVKITCNSGGSAQVLTVKVSEAPAELTLTPAALTLGVGMTGALGVNYPSGCSFASSDEDVATVDASGNVTAIAPGSAAITATSWDGKQDASLVRVLPTPESVRLLPEEGLSIGVGQKGARVSAEPGEEGTLASFVYASEEPGIVQVNAQTGELTPLTPGTTTVSVSVRGSEPEVRAETSVTVKAAPQGLTLHTASLQLGVGDSYQLGGDDVEAIGDDVLASYTYTASAKEKKDAKTDIVTVSADGLITAKKAGTAYARIADQAGHAVAVKVSVSAAAGSITLSAPELTLGVGMEGKLNVSFPNKTFARYSIESSDPEIASVAPGAKAQQFTVTAHEVGDATITVRTASGKADTCHVRVLPGTQGIHWTFTPGTGSLAQTNEDGAYILGVGEKKAALAAAPDEGTLASFSFTSDIPGVLSVNAATGELTPNSAGTAKVTIRVSGDAGVEAAVIPFRIVPKPVSGTLSLTRTKMKLGVGDTFQIGEYDAQANPAGIVQLEEGYSASYTYQSSNTAVATVSAAGLITANKAGTATIRVSTQNAKVYKDIALTVSKYSSSLTITPTLSLGAEMTATLKPTFASGAFGAVEYELSQPGLLGMSIDPNSGACTLSAPERGVLDGVRHVTVTARLRKTGLTDTCFVTLLPEPQAGGIEFDYDAMPGVETDGDGVRYLRVGVKETGVNVVAKCSDPDTLCEYEYTVDRSGLSVSTTGALTATVTSDDYYTVTATAKNNPEATAELYVKVVPVPESVKYSIKTLNLGVGDTFQLRDSREGGIIVLAPDTASASFKFAASKYSDKSATTDVLSVSAAGLITAKKAGTAYVKVTTQNNLSKVLTVKVSKKPASLSLTPETQNVGELSTGTVALTFPSGSYSLVESGHSSDPELLQFEIDPLDGSNTARFSVGRLPGSRARNVTISVTTQSGATATATVTVLPHPTNMEFTQSHYELSGGMTLATQVAFPAGTMAQNLRYESGDEEVATIDENGVITGVNPSAEARTTEITVTANPDTEFEISATATVTVLSAPDSLDYEGLPATLKLARGDTAFIPEPVAYTASGDVIPASFTFTSSDPTYVSVSGNKMKALKTGKAITITAQSHNGKKAQIFVRVYDSAPTDLELYCEGEAVNGGELKLYINDIHPSDSLPLTWQLSGSNVNYGSVRFESNEPQVATVDERGVITATGRGTATITARAGQGDCSAKCKVTVGELCIDPKLSTGDLVLSEGDTEQIDISFAPKGSGMRLRYESENEGIALVDQSGRITAVGGGETAVLIIGQHGWEREIRVRSYYDPDGVTLPVRKLYMSAPRLQPQGEAMAILEYNYDSVVLAPTIKRYGVTQMQDIDLWTEATSSNRGVVEVTIETPATETAPATYRLTARGTGTATVTIKTNASGISAQCEIVVGTPEEAAQANGFGWTVPEGKKLVLMKGDETPLEVALSSDVYRGNNFVIEAKPAGALSLDETNWTIKAQQLGTVTLSLKVDGQVMDTASIDVVTPEKVKLYYGADFKEALPAKANLDVSSFTADFARHEILVVPYSKMDSAVLLGSFSVSVGDPTLLEYDPETRVISALEQEGTAKLTVTNVAGTTTSEVSVLAAPVYRALLISEYNNSGNKNDLPFSQGNINKMQKALGQSDIGGQKYDITTLPANATQAQIKAGIADTFAGAKANDVSLIYIVAHGHMGSGSASEQYAFSLSPGGKNWSTKNEETYVTDTELLSWIKASPAMAGKVVLVIDSCNSGAFIAHQKSGLSKLNNLAVITAQVGKKTASFYVGSYKSIKTFEFFTRAFTTSIGSPVNVGSGDKWNDAKPTDTNGDGYITVTESFTRADALTIKMIDFYCNDTYFNANSDYGFKAPGLSTRAKAVDWRYESKKAGGNGQDPQTYIPAAMKDLIFIGLPKE